MNWIFKVMVQHAFSRLPFGEKLNYFGQRYIVKRLPLSKGEFIGRINIAFRNFNSYSKYNRCNTPADRAIFFEFGAGWDMVIPLSHYLFGINSQIIIDNREIARFELINDSLTRFNKYIEDLPPFISDRLDNALNMYPVSNMQQLREKLGISYKVPGDARATGMADGSIDFISSTATLEHIPAREIPSIFNECYRVLKTGGILASSIDYIDHNSYFDNTVSAYNFLKYSESVWPVFNPTIQYQNRLRHKDFIRMAESAGFTVVADDHYMPTTEDIKLIESMTLHHDFKSNYGPGELAIRNGFIVLIK
jgi:predicted SAM-dependent methyltransferase